MQQIEVGQVWRRRDPEGERVTEFTVKNVSPRTGAVIGLTASKRVVRARVVEMRKGERYEYVRAA